MLAVAAAHGKRVNGRACLRGHREFAVEDTEFECFPFASVEHEHRVVRHGAVADVREAVDEPDLDAVVVVAAAEAALEPLLIESRHLPAPLLVAARRDRRVAATA